MTSISNGPDDSGRDRLGRLSCEEKRRIAQLAINARDLVRCLQCKVCSKPFRRPISLPCGETICRSCLPELSVRQYVSYPQTLERSMGIRCAFHHTMRVEHSIADCAAFITMTKLVDGIRSTLAQEIYHPVSTAYNELEDSQYRPDTKSFSDEYLKSTFLAADTGCLKYQEEMKSPDIIENNYSHHRETILWDHLAAQTLADLECQICCSLFLEPVTTTCGHTFCRRCLYDALDITALCPICRHKLPLPASGLKKAIDENLTNIIGYLQPERLEQRKEQYLPLAKDEPNTPLFVCTLAFPHVPLFLHIFEPRYRLMLRRIIEDGSRTFGMVLPSRSGDPQDRSGSFHAPFAQYGSLLSVTNVQMLPDGRSLVETIGVSRFKVESWDVLDGYHIGRVRRIDDIPVAEEEALEITERTSGLDVQGTGDVLDWERLATSDLFEMGLQFLSEMRTNSAKWFDQRILRVYGEPPEDPAMLPFWLAALLPVSDEQKYLLLQENSVRQRLKMVMRWIKNLERGMNSSCLGVLSITSCNVA